MKPERNHIDLPVFIAVLILMVLSLGVVYSASSAWAMHKWGESGKLIGSHALKVLVGFVAIVVFMHIDYHKYRKLTKPALLAAVGLLIITLALGLEKKGATRWLSLAGYGLQPSEFAKYALIFHLCVLTTEKKDRIKDFKTGFLPMLIWIGTVTMLVMAQPNFSTGAMIVAISLVLLFVGHAKMTHIAMTLGACTPVLVAYMLSAPYRMQRILSYLGMGDGTQSSNARHQQEQAIIGFGNGGIFGLGPGGSKQRELFLPESYGDFVFSIAGEEYGLIGTLFIIGLFLIILLRGMKIAKRARDEFGRTLAIGITAATTLYALIHAGVTLGMLPTTGLPMPFVSYGGSSMLFSSVAIGVLLNISMQTDLHPRVTGAPEGVRPLEPVQAPAVGKVY